MSKLIEGERRLKRYKITAEDGDDVTVSNVECKVYEEDGEAVLDILSTEIMNNGSSSVTIVSLFDTLTADIDPNKTYKVRLSVTVGEEIYIKDQSIRITE